MRKTMEGKDCVGKKCTGTPNIRELLKQEKKWKRGKVRVDRKSTGMPGTRDLEK